MNRENEIRLADDQLCFGEVGGFNEYGDVVLLRHGKRGKRETMTLTQFNKIAWEKASRNRQKLPAATITAR